MSSICLVRHSVYAPNEHLRLESRCQFSVRVRARRHIRDQSSEIRYPAWDVLCRAAFLHQATRARLKLIGRRTDEHEYGNFAFCNSTPTDLYFCQSVVIKLQNSYAGTSFNILHFPSVTGSRSPRKATTRLKPGYKVHVPCRPFLNGVSNSSGRG
jgi:hypothetical protein